MVRAVCPSQMSWRWFETPQYTRRPARPLVSIAVSRAAYMEILFEVAKPAMPWLQPLSSLKWAPLYATGEPEEFLSSIAACQALYVFRRSVTLTQMNYNICFSYSKVWGIEVPVFHSSMYGGRHRTCQLWPLCI